MAGHQRMFQTHQASCALCNVSKGVSGCVGNMPAQWGSPQFLRDCAQKPLLGQLLIVRDIICLSLGLRTVSAEEKPLHYIGDIDEWERITPGAKDKPLVVKQLLGNAPKVQTISGPKDGAWSNLDGGEMIFNHHTLHQEISLSLRNPVRIIPGGRGIFLGQDATPRHTIDGP